MNVETTKAPTPNAAERARSMATRGGPAVLMPTQHSDPVRVEPLLHHVHADGTTALLMPAHHELVGLAWQAPRGELTAMLEITDSAPVRLREPVRGLLWLTGWLQALDPAESRAEALAVAEQRPDHRLLDVGHGAVMLRLVPASLVLADAEGTASVEPTEFTDARPDPFCLMETGWLRHLESAHGDVVGQLAKHIPDELRSGHVRPLGLDRYGLRLRVESITGDHDVRLAFSQPVHDARQLAAELRRLVGCPFLAQTYGH
ncbi:DUF2470 domain-containing protein [Allokutzneria multivorans]|uniref:DUF2470 domain-containing protein n=2 Tax=Allokutzneria multivorans TaxID=1142134 RepID=A0ABP7RES4_9PSEU